MSNYAIIGIAKLKGAAIGSSDSHADRTRETPNADETLLDENIYLRGGKTPLRKLLDENFREFGGKQRKDAVECLEFMCSASPEFFASDESVKEEKTKRFIEKIEEFIEVLDEKGIKIVKAVIHLDETTPHASLFGPPRDENGTLNAKYHIGTRSKMAGFHDVYAEVMKPLGLKRGVRGSRATHQDVKRFYATIISEPELNISSRQLPNPPSIIKNEEQSGAYKEQVIAAVRAEIMPQLTRMRNQAMLTNHYKGFREAAEDRAVKLAEELRHKDIELENKDGRLAETQAKLKDFEDRQIEYAATKKQLAALQTAQADLSFVKVAQILTGRFGDVSSAGETYFADSKGQFIFHIAENADNAAYGIGGEKYAATAIELAQKIHRQNGKMGTVSEAIISLADHFNDEEITAALGRYSFQKARENLRQSAAEIAQSETTENSIKPPAANESSRNEVKIAPAEIFTKTDNSPIINNRLIENEDELNDILDKIQPTEQQQHVSLSAEDAAANNAQSPIISGRVGSAQNSRANGEVEEAEYEIESGREIKSVIVVAPPMPKEAESEVKDSVKEASTASRNSLTGTTIESGTAELSSENAGTVLSAGSAVRNIKSEDSQPLCVPVITKPQDIADAGQINEASEAIKPTETAETPRQTAADPHTNQEFSTKNSNEKLPPAPGEVRIENQNRVENHDENQIGGIVSPKNLSDREAAGNAARQTISLDPTEKIEEISGTFAEESERVSRTIEVAAAKAPNGTAAELTSAIDKQPNTAIPSGEEAKAGIVVLNENDLQKTATSSERQISNDSSKVKESAKNESAKIEEFSEMPKQAVEISVVSDKSAAENFNDNTSFAETAVSADQLKINDREPSENSVHDGFTQQEKLTQKENKFSEDSTVRRIIKDETASKNVSYDFAQPSLFENVENAAAQDKQDELTIEGIDRRPAVKTSVPAKGAGELKTKKSPNEIVEPNLRETETSKFEEQTAEQITEQTAAKTPERIPGSIQNEPAAGKTKTDLAGQMTRPEEITNRIAPKNLETCVSPEIAVTSETSAESVQKSENAQSMTTIVNDLRESDQALSIAAILRRQGSVKTNYQAVEGRGEIKTETEVVEAALKNPKDLHEAPIQPIIQIPVNREELTNTTIEIAGEIGSESNGAIDAIIETPENQQISEITTLPEFNEKEESSINLPVTRMTVSEPAIIASTPINEADSTFTLTNKDYTTADTSEEWLYREQERIFAESQSAQNQQFQNTLEQDNARSQTLQTDFQTTIENLNKQFEQIQELGQRSYEEFNASEDDVFENLRKTTDLNSFAESQPQPLITDDEIQARLERAAATGLPDKTEAELVARHQLQQTEDFKLQQAQQQDADEEEESQDMDFDDEPTFTRGRSM